MTDYLSNLSIDLFILYIEYLPFNAVVKLCNTNKKLHNYCTNSRYKINWKSLIINTFGHIYNYDYKVDHVWKTMKMSKDTYNYIVYVNLIKTLDPISQLMIYYRQGDALFNNNKMFSDRQRFLLLFLLEDKDKMKRYNYTFLYSYFLDILQGKEIDQNILNNIGLEFANQGSVKGVKYLMSIGANIVKDVYTGSEMVKYLESIPKSSEKLIIDMAVLAANSSRAEQILDPFPTIHDSEIIVLDPKRPNYNLVKKLINEIGIKNNEMTNKLIQWLLNKSNSKYSLKTLPIEYQFKSMNTPDQYILSSIASETFEKRKEKYGTVFGFHGSHTENWYSILRSGLKNASGTKLERHGKVLGSGIYFASNPKAALTYSTLEKSSWVGLVLAEIIDRKKTNNVWIVAEDEDDVVLRFFFIYKKEININTYIKPIEFQNEINYALSFNK